MATFEQQKPAANPPAGSFSIRVQDWADNYTDRPVTALRVGLRLPSEGDERYARAVARERTKQHPEEFERELVICAAAVALCDLNDAALPHEAFPVPDEQIKTSLKPETIAAIFDELERLSVAASPIRLPATDEDIDELMATLGDGRLQGLELLDPLRGVRARRFLRYVLDELTDAS